jgi:hypothetical protein
MSHMLQIWIMAAQLPFVSVTPTLFPAPLPLRSGKAKHQQAADGL